MMESNYYPLFKHMADVHGLTLVESELMDIIDMVNRMQQAVPPDIEKAIEEKYNANMESKSKCSMSAGLFNLTLQNAARFGYSLSSAQILGLNSTPVEISSGWVSVKDALPENDVPVIAVWNGRVHLMELTILGYWIIARDEYRIGRDGITHWMPLPIHPPIN